MLEAKKAPASRESLRYRCLNKNTPFRRALAIQSYGGKLISSPRFGVFKASFPTSLLIWRSFFFTDTMVAHHSGKHGSDPWPWFPWYLSPRVHSRGAEGAGDGTYYALTCALPRRRRSSRRWPRTGRPGREPAPRRVAGAPNNSPPPHICIYLIYIYIYIIILYYIILYYII